MSFKIGVNAIVVRDGKLLLGQRLNCYGAGSWGLPGGHLHVGEKIQDGIKREMMEETGMEVTTMQFNNVVNQPVSDGHYMQFGFVVQATGEPVLLEPEFCAEWRWFAFDNLPENIFVAHIEQIECYRDSNNFYE